MTDQRTTDAALGTHTTIIEKRGSGGTVLLAIVLLIAVLVGGWYLFTVAPAQSAKDKAITGAATSVSHAADKAGDAVDPNSK
jgi:apolipoprotein N-acyltransferase